VALTNVAGLLLVWACLLACTDSSRLGVFG